MESLDIERELIAINVNFVENARDKTSGYLSTFLPGIDDAIEQRCEIGDLISNSK